MHLTVLNTSKNSKQNKKKKWRSFREGGICAVFSQNIRNIQRSEPTCKRWTKSGKVWPWMNATKTRVWTVRITPILSGRRHLRDLLRPAVTWLQWRTISTDTSGKKPATSGILPMMAVPYYGGMTALPTLCITKHRALWVSNGSATGSPKTGSPLWRAGPRPPPVLPIGQQM